MKKGDRRGAQAGPRISPETWQVKVPPPPSNNGFEQLGQPQPPAQLPRLQQPRPRQHLRPAHDVPKLSVSRPSSPLTQLKAASQHERGMQRPPSSLSSGRGGGERVTDPPLSKAADQEAEEEALATQEAMVAPNQTPQLARQMEPVILKGEAAVEDYAEVTS